MENPVENQVDASSQDLPEGALDVERLRADTPGLRDGGMIHFNNAGAALPPQPVLDTVIGHLELEARIGGYEAAAVTNDALEATYRQLAALIGAGPDEIGYTDSATRAWDMLFYAVPFRRGDRILTTRSEYPSNAMAFLQMARRAGVSVEVVPDDADGQICLTALEAMLAAGGVRLVAINHVPTHDGLINPAAEVGALAERAGALYLLDACQSVGQLAVDVGEIGCDMLSATGRKFLRAPRGTGFLYVRRDLLDRLEPAFVDLRAADWTGPDSYRLRSDARRFESWERSVAGQLGLGAAAEYALRRGPHPVQRRVCALGAALRDALAAVPGVRVLDRGARKGGIVTFVRDGYEPAGIAARLRAGRINVTVAQHTYRFDAEPAGPRSRVRASVHYYNTEAEIAAVTEAVAAL